MVSRFSSIGDKPSLLEGPGGYIQQDGNITYDNEVVNYTWKRSKLDPYWVDYDADAALNGESQRVEFVRKGPSASLYTATLQLGRSKEWDKIIKLLEKTLKEKRDQLANKVADLLGKALRDAAQGTPFGGAAGPVSEFVKGLVKEVVDKLIEELDGIVFSPIAVC